MRLGPSSLCPPRVHSRDGWDQAFPVFRTLPLPCIILNANRRTKNGGGLGTRLAMVFIIRLSRCHTLCTTGKYGVPYSGKLSREKTFADLEVLWLFTKSFLREIWGRHKWAPAKVYSTKIVFHQFAKVFSLKSFPLCSICKEYGGGWYAGFYCRYTIHEGLENMSIPLLHLGTMVSSYEPHCTLRRNTCDL